MFSILFTMKICWIWNFFKILIYANFYKYFQANQRVEEFKRQLKTLTVKLKEAEARAEFAEKTVKKLQKEVDRLEGSYY